MSSLTYSASFLTSQTDIRKIIRKQYQYRSKGQHKILVDFMQPYFPSLPRNIIKLITFYLIITDSQGNSLQEQKPQNSQQNPLFQIILNSLVKSISKQEFPQNSFVIILQKQNASNNNPEIQQSKVIQQVSRYKQKSIEINFNQVAIILRYEHYLNCMTLGSQTTIQDQIDFFHTSEYLCTMPKKKYYSLLRNAKISSYTIRQTVYFEGQDVTPAQSGSGVYLVRQGQLAYYKKVAQTSKNVEVFRFGTGHLLGSLQLQENKKRRLFTVKSKSSRSVVYNFGEEFFNETIKPYCQNLIQQRQKKLGRFLTDKSKQVQTFVKTRPQIFSLNTTRNFNHLTQLQANEKGNNTVRSLTYRELPSLTNRQKESEKIQKQYLRKTSYFGIKNNGPLKVYPMTVQRAKFTQSQFRDLQKLLEKKQKLSKIKSIKQAEGVSESRGQILFGMFKESWRFQNQRSKTRRY